MATLSIPLGRADTEVRFFEFNVDLEQVTYTMVFRWNSRDEFWYIDLYDFNRNELISGIRLSYSNFDLLSRYQLDTLPPGSLFINDITGSNTAATLEGLGSDYQLIYVESST